MNGRAQSHREIHRKLVLVTHSPDMLKMVGMMVPGLKNLLTVYSCVSRLVGANTLRQCHTGARQACSGN